MDCKPRLQGKPDVQRPKGRPQVAVGLHLLLMTIARFLRTCAPSGLALTLAVCCVGPLHAQWQWRDEAGRRVFSDQPPPLSVPESAILSRPKARVRQVEGSSAAAPVAPKAGADAAAKAETPLRSEAELKAEAELQKRVKAEQAKAAADRADNCQRARRALATVNSGMRIATVNDKGEREFMDDKALAGERQRLESIIRSDCAPG